DPPGSLGKNAGLSQGIRDLHHSFELWRLTALRLPRRRYRRRISDLKPDGILHAKFGHGVNNPRDFRQPIAAGRRLQRRDAAAVGRPAGTCRAAIPRDIASSPQSRRGQLLPRHVERAVTAYGGGPVIPAGRAASESAISRLLAGVSGSTIIEWSSRRGAGRARARAAAWPCR